MYHYNKRTHTTHTLTIAKKMATYIFAIFLLTEQLFNLRKQHPFTHNSNLAIPETLPIVTTAIGASPQDLQMSSPYAGSSWPPLIVDDNWGTGATHSTMDHSQHRLEVLRSSHPAYGTKVQVTSTLVAREVRMSR